MSLVKALETYDPLQVKTHPKLDVIKQLIGKENTPLIRVPL